jgi:hypothetical protein
MLEVFTKRFGAQKSIIRTQESKEAGFLWHPSPWFR